MRALLSTRVGGPETLEMIDLPMPEPKKGEIRVAVKAAGVNFPDTIIIRDLYQFKPPRPFAPGGEVAGVVDAIGDEVEGFAVGDRVLGLPIFGGFVSHICLPAVSAHKIPDAMPFEEAACFVFTYGTSYYGLKDRGALGAGQTLLILGAAGGIGASALELGKAMGATVIAAVSSPEKAAFCERLGADHTIVYPREMDKAAQKEFSKQIKSISREVDAVYDPVGGAYAEPALRCLGWEGRFLVVGFPAGIPEIPLNLPLLKNCQIVGVFWGAFVQRDPSRHELLTQELFQMYEAGQIKPRISETFPLEDAAKALDLIETRKAQGKIVLTL